jgi:hypothetical protein
MRFDLLKLLSWTILLLAFLSGAKAYSEEPYGSIQIRVIKPNPEHNTFVSMRLNGLGFVGFSHALTGNLNTAVLGKFLARSSAGVTPISTDYSGLQAGCEFDYLVYFVMASGGQSIFLGQYHAPTQTMATTIPLAICHDKNQLCSADSQIQKSLDLEIQRAADRQRINTYNQWKRKWDARQADLSRSEANSQKAIAALAASTETETSRPLTQVESELTALEDEIDIARKAEPTASVPSSQTEAPAQLTDTGIDQNLYEIADKAQQDRVERLIQDALEEHLITPDLAMFYRDAAATSAFFADVSANHLAELNCNGDWRRSECLSAKLSLDSAEFAEQNLTRWSTLGEIAGSGFRALPVFGDMIDGCEAVLALEGCRMEGRKLEPWEQGLAALGVVVGSGEAYRKLVKRNPWLGDFLNIEAVKLLEHWEPKTLEHVIVGDLHRYPNGRVAITGGLHTSHGLEQFIAKGGAAPTRDVVAENGVRVVSWVESAGAISMSSLDNVMKVLIDGVKQPTKTLFPPTWNVNKVVEAIHGIAARCANANGVCIETVEGVTIKVAKKNNLVKTAFPLLEDELLQKLLKGGLQ